MALSGVHVTCAYYGRKDLADPVPTLLGPLIWSETMAVGAQTALSAPGNKGNYGPVIFRVYASADVYVAYGPAPDATSGARTFVPAAISMDFIANSGDFLEWALA